jgi:hemerythrin-like domain-containing protein
MKSFMKSPQPIKRSRELAPLSREHHEALLLGWKLRQGIRYNTEASLMGRYTQWFLQHHLEEHFAKEEEGFARILPGTHPMIVRMKADHATIKSQVSSLANNASYMALEELAQKITDHVRFEERELFPLIEQTATPEQLQSILEHGSKNPSSVEWNQEFWVKKD